MDKELLVTVLRLSKDEPFVQLAELKENSSEVKIRTFFAELERVGIILEKTIDGNYRISREQRAQLVILGGKSGIDFEEIIQEITWQEFEILTTMVGDEFGYEALTGLNFSTKERKYQIDVVLRNKPYVFLIDCKHYGGVGKKAALKKAVEEQIERVKAIQQVKEEVGNKIRINNWKKVVLIPMIVTWLDDTIFFHENVPVVPFPKLQSFFRDFYLYFADLMQITFKS